MVAAMCAFLAWPGLSASSATPSALFPPWARYAALLLFSGSGGLIPATLFTLVVKLAPSPQTLGTTMGWVQQGSSLGQFAGPPGVAAVASAVGGWHLTWVATGACAVLGVVLALCLGRLDRRRTSLAGHASHA